jgi:hypothetical protein
MMRRYLNMVVASLLVLSCAIGAADAQDDSACAGKLITERPTLTSLGFEWRVEGDANGNARDRAPRQLGSRVEQRER